MLSFHCLIHSLMCLLVLLSLFTCRHSLANPKLAERISVRRGEYNNLEIIVEQRGITLTAGSLILSSNDKIRATRSQRFNVDPCTVLEVNDEPFQLASPTESDIYWQRMPLCCLAGGKDRGPVTGLLVPGSLEIRSSDGQNLPLVPGLDYKVNSQHDCIDRLSTCRLPDNSTVRLRYSLYRRRIDSLVVDKNGTAHLVQGEPSQFAPKAPVLSADTIHLANILVPSLDLPIYASNVMPKWDHNAIDPQLDELNERALQLFKRKLALGKTVKVGFVGDSVTCGCYATAQNLTFPQLFIERLRAEYPSAKIGSTICAVGGSTSTMMFPRFIKEVLPQKPDLVVIEFVNDLNLNQASISSNYKRFLQEAKAAGCDVIVCLPHLVQPSIYKMKDWSSLLSMPYFELVRNIAVATNVGIADIASRYSNARYEALTPELLLADNFNHPNDRGHRIYVEELLKSLAIHD